MRQHSHKAIGTMAVLVLILLAASVPQAQAVVVTQTRFFSGRSLNVYKVGTTASTIWKSIYQAKVGLSGLSCYAVYEDFYGNLTLYTGIRVYQRDANGTETQLTTDVSAIVELAGPLEEWDYGIPFQRQGYWTPSNTTLLKTDILAIKAYSSTDNATWAQFTSGFYSQWNTESLLSTQLVSSTWNITYEIIYSWDLAAEAWHVFACWASGFTADQQPRISNIQLDNGETTPTEEINMLPVGFLLGAMIAIPIGLLIAKKH